MPKDIFVALIDSGCRFETYEKVSVNVKDGKAEIINQGDVKYILRQRDLQCQDLRFHRSSALPSRGQGTCQIRRSRVCQRQRRQDTG